MAYSLKCLSEGLDAQILFNGALLVGCKSMDQVGKAKKMGKIAGKKVEVIIPQNKNLIKGVIYGICADVSKREIKENLKGGEVREVK